MTNHDDLIGDLNAPRRRQLTPEQREMLRLIETEEKKLKAREDFQSFIEYMMPDPGDYDDPHATMYVSKPVHKLMREFWTEIDTGRSMRSAMSVPPQTGKTTHTSVMGVAWSIGRNPQLRIVVGTYNETRAKEIGEELRHLIESERYQSVFPEVELDRGGKSKSHLMLKTRGDVRLVGRGTGVTGRPVDLFVIDDPVKDKAEAQSTAALEECWNWFSTTAMQRAHNLTKYVIIHTRWAGNDLIGRMCDTENPDYDPEKARGYTYLNVKAYDNEPHVAEMLGIEPEEYIWPEKFSPELLNAIRVTMSPEDFSALYMGKPVPDEGGFFQKDMIVEYGPNERPPLKELKVYAASDHAVSTKDKADYTVLIVAGVDNEGQIWLLDCVRQRMPTDRTVEAMIQLMKHYRPITWWAASDHISRSIGPFLKRRMREESVYATHVEDSPEIGNKMQKAQSIRGMMALNLVKFPRGTHWYQDLVNELLRFRGEGDVHDDQVDALAHLGRGLDRMLRGRASPANDKKGAMFGTYAWLKADMAAKKAQEAQRASNEGW